MKSRIQKLIDSATADDDQSSISSAKRVFSNYRQAQTAFLELKKKIRFVAEWNKISGITSYALFDENGKENNEEIFAKAKFLRLSLTGSGKYDWVKIVEIYESETEFVITVKPTFDPTDKHSDPTVISHFFTSESSNNFCLLQEATAVSFYVIGLNEKQNTTETENMLETVRNLATANIGHYFGIQKTEWEKFCKNLLDSYSPKN